MMVEQDLDMARARKELYKCVSGRALAWDGLQVATDRENQNSLSCERRLLRMKETYPI